MTGGAGAAADGDGGTAMIGVVVPVPEPWAQLLVDWRTKVGDPQATLVPPHVTLLPPTEVPVADRAAVAEHLAGVARAHPAFPMHLAGVAQAHPAFPMHLAGTGTFSPVTEVVFVTVARGIGNCELLATDVRQGPLARPLAYPYHPHVTVAHDVAADMLELAYSGLAELSAEFPVEHFTEFEQRPDGSWAIAREYPLTGPPR